MPWRPRPRHRRTSREVRTIEFFVHNAGHVAITVAELTLASIIRWPKRPSPTIFEHAAQLYSSFQRNLAHGSLAIAAFELHQLAETISKAVLVVFTAYLPKMHDLDELGRR